MNSARNLQRLNAIQRTRNLTNAEVAEIIGRSAQTVGAYRCGARVVPDDAIERLEAWYNGDSSRADSDAAIAPGGA